MSTPPRKQSAPAAVPCDWKGDPVEPEFDDLANQHRPKPPPRPEDPCHWMGDPAEPEEDDLAYQHAPRPKPPPPETGEPEPTPLEPPVLPAEELPQPLPLVPVPSPPSAIPVHMPTRVLPTRPVVLEPVDHHVKPPTPPPLLVEEVTLVAPRPQEISKAERERQRKEERAKEHEERRRARKDKERAKKELKHKKRAERKDKEKAKKEARKKEKHEKKARKGKGQSLSPISPPLPAPAEPLQEVEPVPVQSPHEERDEATKEAESIFPGPWQGLPTLSDLADGIRNMLPGPSSAESRKASKTDDDSSTVHQLQEDIEHLNDLNQHLKEDKRQENPIHHNIRAKDKEHHQKEHHENKHAHIGSHHHGAEHHHHKTTYAGLMEQEGLDGASDQHHAVGNDQPASSSSNKATAKSEETPAPPGQSAPTDPHADVLASGCDCGHSSNVPRSQQASTVEQGKEDAQPGKLKRASCLCGVMPPEPSEFAAYETPPFLTPRIDTPGHEDRFAADNYFKK